LLITEFLWHNERHRGAKAAFVSAAGSLSNTQFAARVRRLAHALRALGIQPRQHVAVLCSTSPEHQEVIFALSAIGAVWVPLNTRLSARELTFIIENAEAVALVYSADMLALAEEIGKAGRLATWIGLGEKATLGHAHEALIARGADSTSAPGITPDDLFALMYTSGTTGLPKGVMLTHRQFFFGTVCSTLVLRPAEDDVKLQLLPQFHAGGQIWQLAFMAAGATIATIPRFDVDGVLDSIDGLGVSAVGFVPSMLTMLLESPRIANTDFGRLRRVIYGAAPIPEDRLSRAMEVMHAAGFQQTYGLTEAGVLSSVLGEADHLRGLRENHAILRSCGRQMLGYTMEVVDDAGVPLPDGSVGEMAIRSDSLMRGYWKRPDATAKSLVDGWLRTGDLAYRDAEGYYFLVDRKTDMIISGGENVYPIEVENVISAHPAVLEVAVIGVPDARWGEAVKAVVVPREGESPGAEAIISFCRGKLGGFKIPKSVDFIDRIPRNASGKITKNVLRAPYWEGKSRRI